MSLKDDKQQNIQLELDFSAVPMGEARQARGEETEPSGAMNGPENPASTNRLMEEVCERENLKAALQQVKADPFSTGELVSAMGAAISIDGDLDPIDAAGSLRTAVDSGLVTYSLPVVPKTVAGAAVLLLGDGAEEVLAYFNGTGPAPAPGS